jgi:hypothetical protein
MPGNCPLVKGRAGRDLAMCQTAGVSPAFGSFPGKRTTSRERCALVVIGRTKKLLKHGFSSSGCDGSRQGE